MPSKITSEYLSYIVLGVRKVLSSLKQVLRRRSVFLSCCHQKSTGRWANPGLTCCYMSFVRKSSLPQFRSFRHPLLLPVENFHVCLSSSSLDKSNTRCHKVARDAELAVDVLLLLLIGVAAGYPEYQPPDPVS